MIAVVVYHGVDGGSHFDGAAARLVGPLETFGLALFGVIAAFQVYRPFALAHYRAQARPSFRRYYIARALRVVPAYWLVLTVAAFTVGVPGMFEPGWWWQYLFVGVVADWNTPLLGLAAAWGLSTLVAFYFALPLYVLLRRLAAPGLAVTTLLLAPLAVGSLGLQVWYWQTGGSLGRLNLTLPALFFVFAIGIWLADLTAGREVRDPDGGLPGQLSRWPLALGWGSAAVVYGGLCLVLTLPGLGAPIQAYSAATWIAAQALPALAAGLALLPAVFDRRLGRLSRLVLGSPVLTAIGGLALGLFLWYPVTQGRLHFAGVFGGRGYDDALLFAGLTLLATLPLAWVTSLIAERPFMNYARAHRQPGSTAAR